MAKTKIEWTKRLGEDAGMTWNPVTGCSKVSQGCKNCYALRDWSRLAANPKNVYAGREFTDVMIHPERLGDPLRWTKPRMVFVNSMSDLFHELVPDDFIDQVFAVMVLAPHHTFQVLTKRPERMLNYLSDPLRIERIGLKTEGHVATDWPGDNWPLKNVWLGVSVEDQSAADERIPLLLQVPAAVRWISAEPLLGAVDLALLGTLPSSQFANYTQVYDLLHWVVAGGESGPDARPMHPSWARSLRDQCADAGVPFLFKQWGEFAPESSIFNDGSHSHDSYLRNSVKHICEAGEHVYRVGRKRAGRLLDGVLHGGYPL